MRKKLKWSIKRKFVSLEFKNFAFNFSIDYKINYGYGAVSYPAEPFGGGSGWGPRVEATSESSWGQSRSRSRHKGQIVQECPSWLGAISFPSERRKLKPISRSWWAVCLSSVVEGNVRSAGLHINPASCQTGTQKSQREIRLEELHFQPKIGINAILLHSNFSFFY